jgi:hypothetical protein
MFFMWSMCSSFSIGNRRNRHIRWDFDKTPTLFCKALFGVHGARRSIEKRDRTTRRMRLPKLALVQSQIPLEDACINFDGAHMKRLLIALLSTFAIGTVHAEEASSAASQSLGDASAMVVGGTLLSVAGGVSLVVASARVVGDGIELVLDGAAGASVATVRLSGAAARGLSVAAGTTLDVVAVSTGHMLVLSGAVLAFIPNEAGKALLHHARAA